MKDIKFRAWHREKQVMITVCTLDFTKRADGKMTQCCEGYYGVNERIHFGLHEVDLLQYTGLKDKNGKEIYEGDIVGYINTDSFFNRGLDYNKKRTMEIQWGDWCYIRPPEKEYEVIGNIYENPELLTSTDQS